MTNHSVNSFVKETRCGVGNSVKSFYREGKFRSMIISLKKFCQPCFHKLKKSLSLQELSLAETKQTKVKELAVLRHRMAKFPEPIVANCFSSK